ncbi:protein-associating with the carboxyl-terminal domain of ezrin isoform X2 [Zalophus californianus]|uniref:Protein-associating with the carboxyl-terminal domain of ezrin isoform X2 n=1 Tax=Zalophus californianus TaxID=9704 RepID=A0A6J2EGC4_ZALCA|nr:protein-associating with the carboxyl-terminal domain of ezrin isoform X2 [Zalophus californianus]
MGSESSALKSYALKEPPFTLPSGLAVYPAVLQDGRCASVFVYKRENEDKVNKAAKHLKTLRHPCLLRFLSCTVEAAGIHLVTERVQPLEVALETLSSAEVCAGIYDILLALIFLHDRGHLTHNNVCLSSVFVSEDGHWKLGGMETVCKVPQATPEFLRSIQSVRDPASIPPEEMSPEFTTLPESHGHARDAYAFGTLVESLLTILSEQVSADVLSSFQQTLHSTLLNPIPKCRPALCTLLSHDFFRNDFLEVVNFLKSLTLKSEEEKTEFFKFLLDRVSCLSEELIASRLVPLLLNQLVFAEPVAVKSFLPHLLGPKKDSARGDTPCLLSPALFQSRVIPVLLQLFEVHEEHVRMVLLSHLEAYVEHFTQEQLKKIILPQPSSAGVFAWTRGGCGRRKNQDLQTHCPKFYENGQPFPRSMPVSKKHIQQDCYNTLLQTGHQFPQPIKFPMNGLSDVKNTPGDSENFPPSSKKSEEWPDWSEPEEPENKAVSIQICPTEAYHTSTSPLTNVNTEEVVWDDFEPSSLDTEISARGGVSAVSRGTSGEQEAIPTLVSLTEESKPLKLSLPQKTNLAQSGDDPDQTKPPKVSSQERRLKAPSELGLGEEFTIQVKKKPVQDPELDWFADMIPEIKPSAAILILPELRTEMMVSDKDDISPVMQFSSKFAAAEMTEGESEGWGDEGELNWEDNNW